jgi:methionyl-tRNA synthetase
VVNFFGFDNSYFYAILHAALLIAAEQRAWLPYSTVTNEFYNLEHSKFSTSKDHVVWARDLAKRHSTDLIRFYAALNAPGWEKANFKEEEMTVVAATKLSEPWQAVTKAYGRLLAEGGDRGEVRREISSATAAIVSRILTSLSLERFNLRQAAQDLTHFLEYIRCEYCSEKSSAIELAFLLKAFAQASFPIMPAGGGRLFHALTGRGLDGLDVSPESIARPIPDDLFVTGGLRAHQAAPAGISTQAVSA